MEFGIREMVREDYGLLEDFLYEAVFVPEGTAPPPRSVLGKGELRVYIEGFGEGRGDMGLVGEVGGRVVGAIWVRIMNDYGHIDDETPSFAISLYREYRGYGIGTALMRGMLELLRERGYKRGSLSVQKGNYAVNMYRKVGFEIVEDRGDELLMVCDLG